MYLNTEGNSEFFDEIIGVTNFENRKAEQIMLKVHNKDRYNRMKLNRVHYSMSFNDNKNEISLKVKRNPELINFIMEHSDQVEIISPMSLRKEIKRKLKKAIKIYK